MEFWTEPQMASIHKMLNPRSIAIVGATPRMQYGGRFLAAALKAKDRVRVYAVNPRYDVIMGVKSYPSVTNLPEAPDVVGIVVPYDQVLDVLQESHRKGTGSAIVISAGFAERGVDDRRDLQGELGEFDRADRPGVPKRRDGVRAVPGAGGGERHRLQLYNFDRERGRPRFFRLCPLFAGRPGYNGHCRFCRGLQAGR
jgi:predicted CoA-binding protein